MINPSPLNDYILEGMRNGGKPTARRILDYSKKTLASFPHGFYFNHKFNDLWPFISHVNFLIVLRNSCRQLTHLKTYLYARCLISLTEMARANLNLQVLAIALICGHLLLPKYCGFLSLGFSAYSPASQAFTKYSKIGLQVISHEGEEVIFDIKVNVYI